MSENVINKSADNRVRVNITMSKEMVDFYQSMSESMGLARSACMVMALKTYMDQQNMLILSNYVSNNTVLDENISK